MSSLMVWRWCR